MKKIFTLLFVSFLSLSVFAGNVEKTFHIPKCEVTNVGQYQTVLIDNAKLSGIPGEPTLPYLAVSLMLPPGETAASIEIIRTHEVVLPGTHILYPKQDVIPLSKKPSGEFLKKESVYSMNAEYPASPAGHLLTQYLNGYTFALSTFTPVSYNPATGKVSYFSDVIVRITTRTDARSSATLKNLTSSKDALSRVRSFAQNPEMMNQYPAVSTKKSSYPILIITPFAFEDGFTDLISYYAGRGMETRIESTEDIIAGIAGNDTQEKIRNYIKQEYQNNQIEYVLLGGTEQWVPSRRFYCVVNYSTGGVEEESWDIPADIYYSALDGTDDLNGNLIYGEVADSTDLLPDVAVGRLPFTTQDDLASMVHKSVSYQSNPVPGEASKPLLVGEYLYDTPITLGGPYMDLLADNHNDNGYSTIGIPSSTNTIDRLYDTLTAGPGSTQHYEWNTMDLINKINAGTSFIHHLGHANAIYMMRMDVSQITDANFSGANGVDHNYSLIYTQGCDDGSFDDPNCIASKSLSINNFAVAGIFNSRFGWFDQGTTDGPSEHLQREFVAALWGPTAEHHIGKTHMISKIQTAPWIGLPGEFEPGAQRWTQYDCTLLGDPALWIRTTDYPVGTQVKTMSMNFSIYPNPSHGILNVNIALLETSDVTLQILDATGQQLGNDHSWKDETSGKHQYSVDLTGFSSGVYYCRIQTNLTSQTKKLVVIR
jgi:hypothetical protein